MDIDEFLRMTKEFNLLLRENPKDVDSWCKYINLQDKGEGTKNGIASKKLAILDKALEQNSSSDVLLALKLSLMEELFPYDKVVSEAKILASKHASSKVGWRWLISSTQFNLNRLTVPGLISHFGAMLEDSTKRGGQPKFILDVLLEVGLFLRQAGLWELMWTLVEQYLEICFTVIGSGAFKISVTLPEQEIEKIEDGIMTSGLPLHALWIRTEHLRSCVHFLPSTDEQGDHQRLVLPEDVAPLMYPITSDLSTRLAGVALTLLKVPPLPCSEAFVTYLGLKKIPWHLESSEILLTAMVPTGVTHGDCSYLNDLKELLVPPQYIKDNLGSDVFLEAVEKMFNLIAEHCQQDRINFLVWEIRWWRYCVKTKSLSGPSAKTFLSKAKSILKKERTALPIYTEYALLEESAGNIDAAVKVLETAINLQEPGLLAGKREKRHIFASYRTYAEVLLRNRPTDYKEKFFDLMVAMAYGEKLDKVKNAQTDLIRKAHEKFEHITSEMTSTCDIEESPSLEDIIIGYSDLHWLACHGWFTFILHGCLPKFLDEDLISTRGPVFSEGLLQLRIDILGQMRDLGGSTFDHGDFVDLVTSACSRYPNNTSILHTLSTVKCHGLKWSKICSYLVLSGSQIAIMFLALLSKIRLFTGDAKNTGAVNKMFSILTTCTKYKELERCPMLRRLILQYVSCTLDENIVEKEYHKAVEKCPWVKMLFYEAANQLPKLLADVQDLLTEKELRIHVTPEELEILREPAPAMPPQEDLLDNASDGANDAVDIEENKSDIQCGVELSKDSEEPKCDGVPVNKGEELPRDVEHEKGTIEPPESVETPYDPEDLSSSSDSDSSSDTDDEFRSAPQHIPTGSDDWEAERQRIARELWESSQQKKLSENYNPASQKQVACAPQNVSDASDLEANKMQDGGKDDWDEERIKTARRLWESKRAAKRKLEEASEKEELEEGAQIETKEQAPQNDMKKLEEEEVSKMAEDTCEDEKSAANYDDTQWNKDRLKIMRELWESKRKK
uniref:Uncharacterized protein n=1 Tax=Lygus hesperus TaxID=30085 RepID=A0A0A9XLV0_LYGHE